MRADELLPRCRGLTLRSRWETMPLQDVAHGLVTDAIPKVGQSPHDTVIAPRAILLGHPHNQGLQLLVDLRPPQSLAWRGAVKLLGDTPAVPCQDRVRLDDRGHFRQR